MCSFKIQTPSVLALLSLLEERTVGGGEGEIYTLNLTVVSSFCFLFCSFFFSPVPLQAEQQKKAAVISAEGDSKAAELIANSLATAGDGLIELRKLEAAEDIAYQLSRSRNITYLPSGQSVLLQLPQ